MHSLQGSALFVQRGEKQLNIRCAARLEGFKGVHMKAYYGMNYHAKYLLSSFTQLVGPRNQAFIRVSPLRCLRSAFEARNQPFCSSPPCQMSDKDRLIEMNTSELPTDVTNVQGIPFQLTCFRRFWLFLLCWKKLLVKMSLGTPAEPLALISWG